MKLVTHAVLKLVAIGVLVSSITASADPVSLSYRSFSSSAAIGPPAEAFAARLQIVTRAALGPQGEVHFTKLSGFPAVPTGDIVQAVAAGFFDAAYISGSELNKTWGFIYNSGIPFGPTFDEFIGFLYGRSVDNGQKTGLDLLQDLLDLRSRGVVAIPIVASPEQLSGYFGEPMGDVHTRRGIGLAGLCQQHWVLRYLPPGEGVIGQACEDLVASHKIPKRNLTFIQAIPGGGSLIDAVAAKVLDGFEFATPLDDVSQLISASAGPVSAGIKYVHVPGWHQQFLITWMIVGRKAWSRFNAAQQLMVQIVARESVITSYAESMRQQGQALQALLASGVVLSQWPLKDQARLRDASVKFLDARASDSALAATDRGDYSKILEAVRAYARAGDLYWSTRRVDPRLREVVP